LLLAGLALAAGSFAATVLALAAMPATASTVLDFESLPTGAGAMPLNYSGLEWVHCSDYHFDQAPVNAASGDQQLYADNRLNPIYSGQAFVFEGAYSVDGGTAPLYHKLFLNGDRMSNSAAWVPTATPSFLASGYAGAVDVVMIYSEKPRSFVMDNFPFSTALPIPEPATAFVLASGLALLSLKRRLKDSVAARRRV
jgi:hypothetical protein